jgi:hypothetical protein
VRTEASVSVRFRVKVFFVLTAITAACLFGAADTWALSPTLGPVSIVEVTSDSAVLAAGVNPNGSRTTYYFQYGNSSTFEESSNTLAKAIGNGSLEISIKNQISNLQPDTVYYFRLIATNAMGTTEGTFKDGTAGSFETELVPCESVVCQLPPSLSDPSLATLAPGLGNPPVVFHRFCRKNFVRRGERCFRRHRTHRQHTSKARSKQ